LKGRAVSRRKSPAASRLAAKITNARITVHAPVTMNADITVHARITLNADIIVHARITVNADITVEERPFRAA